MFGIPGGTFNYFHCAILNGSQVIGFESAILTKKKRFDAEGFFLQPIINFQNDFKFRLYQRDATNWSMVMTPENQCYQHISAPFIF